MILGIDEAGRGCVVGPLVLAAAAMDNVPDDPMIRDSKTLSPEQRKSVVKQYKGLVTIKYSIISPIRIDADNMNELELNGMRELCRKFATNKKLERVIIDSPFRNSEEIGLQMSKEIGCEVILKHKADRDFKIVGLASIFAKVRRDSIIAGLRKKLGYDFGSGYPADERTIEFLKQFPKSKWKGIIRTKWKTIENIKQRRLDEFQ